MEKKITHGNFLKYMSVFPQDQKKGGKTCAATSLLASNIGHIHLQRPSICFTAEFV